MASGRPAAHDLAPNPPVARRLLLPEMQTPSLGVMPIRALVVDDHVDVASATCELLQLLGCKTAAAFGGITGARLAELFRPDIVFLDFSMPDLDGEGALTRIREAGRVDALFVCMTGRDDPEVRERSLQAGFDHFLTKPVEPEVFARLVDQVRQSRRRGPAPAPMSPPMAGSRPPVGPAIR
jgi:CheY-like chemotaxis protein